MDNPQRRSALPWVVAGLVFMAMSCACLGVLGFFVLGEGEDGGTGEWFAIRRAALSHKGHRDPFSAPDGAVVHIQQSEVLTLREMDLDLMPRIINKGVGAPELLDVYPTRAYRVDIYQDNGDEIVSRVTIDLDRDGKLDEQWKVEGLRVRRALSTRDDENYDQMWLYQNDVWLRQD